MTGFDYSYIIVTIIFVSGTYSPNGLTVGCIDCPNGYIIAGGGETLVDQCTGIKIYKKS